MRMRSRSSLGGRGPRKTESRTRVARAGLFSGVVISGFMGFSLEGLAFSEFFITETPAQNYF
jgi:hypothetical protein